MKASLPATLIATVMAATCLAQVAEPPKPATVGAPGAPPVEAEAAPEIVSAEVTVGVSYGTEPEKVQEILIEVARTHPDVMSNPEPVTLFAGFGESYLDFELRCWTAESFHRVRSELAIAINRSLTKAGIEISSRNGICTCAAMKQRTLNEKTGYFVSHPARF